MKRLILLLACLLITSIAFGISVNDDELNEAIRAYETGQEITKEQHKLLEQYYFEVPVIDHTGGPDDFGYTYRDSEEDNGPNFYWIDITGSGTEIAYAQGLGDDDYLGPFDIGFTFPFYGVDRTEFYVHSNGVISFDDWNDYAPYSNSQLPAAGSLLGACLCMYWDDLDPDNGEEGDPDDCKVYYDVVTIQDTQICVITYVNVDDFPDGSTSAHMTAQALFAEDGRIRFQYQDFTDGTDPWDFDSETIGIVNDDRSIWLEASYAASPPDYPYEGLAIQFYPPRGPVQITLTPDPNTIVVPANGGTVFYDTHISSSLQDEITVDSWGQVRLPSGNRIVLWIMPITIEPGETTTENMFFDVPGLAPAGMYQYRLNLGYYPGFVGAFDSFSFEKLGTVGTGIWNPDPNTIPSSTLGDAHTGPTSAGLEISTSPNPFNAMTTVTVTLQESSELTVAVYNVVGQQVATLHNGTIAAGSHALNFDASSLASGLYFVRATVPGQLDQTQKVMLVR